MGPEVITRTVDGPLGRWRHASCQPRHLAGLVEDIWLFDGELANRRERTFPNGLLEIFVHLGERYRLVEDGGAACDWVCPPSCVTGLQLGHLVVEAPQRRVAVLGIRLTPAGAYAIFARSMRDITRLTVDVGDLVGAAARELSEECGTAASDDGCMRAAIAWIDARLARGVRLDPAVEWMSGEIRRRRGAVSIAALRERTGWSKSRLASTFLHQVGVAPKQLARIARFNHLLRRLHTESTHLSELAIDCGYYDQPHMNAEFKELSGLTPVEFANAVRYPLSVHVAEKRQPFAAKPSRKRASERQRASHRQGYGAVSPKRFAEAEARRRSGARESVSGSPRGEAPRLSPDVFPRPGRGVRGTMRT